MSEFSSGIMIQSCHKNTALKFMEEGTELIQLNDSWLCMLSESDYCNDIAETNYTEEVLNLSEHIPLLNIVNAEDHEFMLGILYHKKLVFNFGIEYDVESEFVFQTGLELYGEEYIEKLFDEEVTEHVKRETEKRFVEVEGRVQSFFSNISPEQIGQFRLFGFQQDVCDKIQHILTCRNYHKDKSGHQMTRELLAALKLEEFQFISYDYVSNNREFYTIVQEIE